MSHHDAPLFVIVSGSPYHGVRRSARGVTDALGKRTRVLFVDPPTSFATKKTKLIDSSLDARGSTVQESTSVFRLAPNAPPGKDRPGVRRVTTRTMARQIRASIAQLGADRWVLFQQSAHHSVLGRIGEQMSFYHSSDDLAAGARLLGLNAGPLEKSEQNAAQAADIVLAVSPALVDRWSQFGVPTELFPNGVDAAAFADTDSTPPSADVTLPLPIAGVVGTLSERLDMDLLHAVAERMSLLLVGPESFRTDRSGFAALIRRPSVQWVGQVPFESLGSYYRHIDVALLPYTMSAFNQASFPLKLLEYLAVGRPIVSTPLRSVQSVNAPAVRLASTPEEFANAALQSADVMTSPEWSAPLRSFARGYSWTNRADRLLEIVAEQERAA